MNIQGPENPSHEFIPSPRSFQYLPHVSNLRDKPLRQDTHLGSDGYGSQFPASPSFQKGRAQSQYYIPEHSAAVPDDNKLMNEIRPRISEILLDKVSQNKEVQRGLDELRNLQQRLEMDISSSESFSHKNYNKNGYSSQINQIIDKLIMHSEQESLEFRQSLYHLKNVNASFLHEGIEEENSDQSGSQEERSAVQRNNQQEPSYHYFLDELSSIEERLFNEIIALRNEKQQILEVLNSERQINNQLQRDYALLQKDYDRLLQHVNQNSAPIHQHHLPDQRTNQHIHKQHHREYDHERERYQKQRSKSKRNINTRSYNQNLKGTIIALEERLREASQQKVQLQRAIKNFAYPETDSNSQKLMENIRVLDDQLATSERKAAKLFPYKLNSDRLMEELQIVTAENNKLRKETGFRPPSPGLQNYKTRNALSSNANSGMYGNTGHLKPTSNDDENGYEYTMRERDPQDSRAQRQDNEYSDRLDEYKWVLNTIRSINR